MEVAHPGSVLFLLATLVMPAAGCQPAAETPAGPRPGSSPAETPPAASTEHWYAYFLQEGKLGHLHLASQPDGERVTWTATSRLVIERQGQQSEVNMAFVSVETPAGEVKSVRGSARIGPTPLKFEGRVEGDQLVLTSTGQPTQRIPWQADYRGFFAVEQSLADSPMQPGETRTIKKLEPIVNQVATVTLAARDLETVKLLDGSAKLLRVEQSLTFADGTSLDSVVWTDRAGVTQKIVSNDQMTAYLTTKEQALAKGKPGQFDLALDTLVKLKRKLDQPHQTRQIRYRVRLKTGDPAKVFAAGATQRIQSQDDGSIRLTVRARRPDDEDTGWDARDARPTDAETGSNSMIQTDDPKVRQIAQSVAPDETDAWKLACALEAHVHQFLRRRNFSQAFASAADVARDPQGDCTEHAVLLAALARARGIPARLAIGLVYLSKPEPAFAYHMWNEVYVNDRWVPVDGTLGRGGIGAAHLKLTHTSLKDGSAYTAFLPVSKVLGKLQVEIEDVK